jgi:oxygenase
VGARLPPDGLAELLHDGMGVLLDSTSDGLVEDTARPWAGRVRAVRVTAPRPGFEPGSAVLARPDGHVAWLGRDGRGLRTALSRWFGLPR